MFQPVQQAVDRPLREGAGAARPPGGHRRASGSSSGARRLPGPQRGDRFRARRRARARRRHRSPRAPRTRFGRALKGREVVTFDQRGIGGSGLLRCPTLDGIGEQTLHIAGAAADCADRLGPRRAFYTTRDSVEDLEAVRRAVHAQNGDPLRHLLRDQARARLRGRVSAARRAPCARLRRRGERAGPVHAGQPRGGPAHPAPALRTGCARFTQDPAADLAALVASIAHDGLLRGPLVRRTGGRIRHASGRIRLIDLLFAGDFDPTLRAAYTGCRALRPER